MEHRSSSLAGSLALDIDKLSARQVCLGEASAKRLSARRLQQRIPETSTLPPSADVLFVYHVAGTGVVERWYDGAVSASGSAPGTVTVLARGRASGWHVPNDVEVLHLYVPGELVATVAVSEFDLDPSRVEVIDTFGTMDFRGAALAQAAMSSLDGPAGQCALFLDALAHALAVHLLCGHAVLPRRLMDHGLRPHALSAQRLARVRDFIEAQLGGELELEDLARAACLSTFHFSRCFRAATGETPHGYVMRRRVERSKELLTDRDMSLADVAYGCGFASQSHFTAAFKKPFGMTPGLYRRTQRP